MKKSRKFIYGLWSIGFVLLLIIANKLEIFLENKTSVDYLIQPYVSIKLLIYFFIGIYISLLFIRKWKLNINVYLLLFVFIPSILLLIMESYIYILIVNVNIIALVSGLTILQCLFDDSSEKIKISE